MISVCLYFQVHQPFRLNREFSFFEIGSGGPYFDESLNSHVIIEAAKRCYLPTNELLLDKIKRHAGRFRVSFSISGTALDQFEAHAPEVIDSFRELVDTDCVEMLCETYYHSLAYLYDRDEFRQQVEMHRKRLGSLFGVRPTTFRNTELIYDSALASEAAAAGFKTILTEGAKQVLGWRTPNFLYRPHGEDSCRLLLRNSQFSDDLAFRFKSTRWPGGTLVPEDFADRIAQLPPEEGELVNIFLDYETFGEHFREASGIHRFLHHLPDAILSHQHVYFQTPSEMASTFQPMARLDIPNTVSWADTERDVTAWTGNPMQDASLAELYQLKDAVSQRAPEVVDVWRRLQTSDHFYYMCTKWLSDGIIHKQFSPYATPHNAFVVYSNVLNDFKLTHGL